MIHVNKLKTVLDFKSLSLFSIYKHSFTEFSSTYKPVNEQSMHIFQYFTHKKTPPALVRGCFE
jgi:hypothetical protein